MLSMHSKLRLLIALVAMGCSAQSLAEGDVARGEVLANTCIGCHGVDSYNNVYPTYHVPRIAGQSAAYLEAALLLYREGNRSHATMTAQAASYSDQDIKDIAAYLASVGGEIDPAAAAAGEAPAAAVVCAACHGAAGVSAIPTNPHLAGQHLDYLQQSTQQYISGARKGANAMVMQAQMNAISPEDLQQVLEFYASQKGLGALQLD